eukprot:414273-Pyramimonas_sp.AAC.1
MKRSRAFQSVLRPFPSTLERPRRPTPTPRRLRTAGLQDIHPWPQSSRDPFPGVPSRPGLVLWAR